MTYGTARSWLPGMLSAALAASVTFPPRHHGVTRSHGPGGPMTTDRPRKTDTRQALIDAALEVFLQRGFARATTREIAQTAGVAEGTIYRHFADKYALFHEVFLARSGET